MRLLKCALTAWSCVCKWQFLRCRKSGDSEPEVHGAGAQPTENQEQSQQPPRTPGRPGRGHPELTPIFPFAGNNIYGSWRELVSQLHQPSSPPRTMIPGTRRELSHLPSGPTGSPATPPMPPWRAAHHVLPCQLVPAPSHVPSLPPRP